MSKGKLTKAGLVESVAEASDVTKIKAQTAVQAILDELREAIGRGERVELRGFGVFETKDRKTGVGRNPKTGVEAPIPPGKAVRFKAGKDLRSVPRAAAKSNQDS